MTMNYTRITKLISKKKNNIVDKKRYAKEMQVSIDLVREVKEKGKLPVVNFAAGGVATPADAALMMQLGMDGVFVGSGVSFIIYFSFLYFGFYLKVYFGYNF